MLPRLPGLGRDPGLDHVLQPELLRKQEPHPPVTQGLAQGLGQERGLVQEGVHVCEHPLPHQRIHGRHGVRLGVVALNHEHARVHDPKHVPLLDVVPVPDGVYVLLHPDIQRRVHLPDLVDVPKRDHVRELLQRQAHEPHRVEGLNRHRDHGHHPDLGGGQGHKRRGVRAPAHALDHTRVDRLVRDLGHGVARDLVRLLIHLPDRSQVLVLVDADVHVRSRVREWVHFGDHVDAQAGVLDHGRLSWHAQRGSRDPLRGMRVCRLYKIERYISSEGV